MDPVEEELQAILAGTPWPPHNDDQLFLPPAQNTPPVEPPIYSLVIAKHGANIEMLTYYPELDHISARLYGGKTIRYNSAGHALRISYPGLRGVLYDLLDITTRWLPDRAAPWRRP